jgi:hypothetical protein
MIASETGIAKLPVIFALIKNSNSSKAVIVLLKNFGLTHSLCRWANFNINPD